MLWARVLGLLNQQKLTRGQTRNPGKALLRPRLQPRVSENKQVPCSLPPRGWATGWFLYGGGASRCRGLGPAGPGGGLGGRPTPLVVPCVGDISILLLLPTPCFCSWPFRRHFCILLSIICPSGTCTKLFLAPYSLFVFCRSRCKHCRRGSRSQVLACFIFGREALVKGSS